MPKDPLLGSVLVNNENYYRIVEFLRPEDFYLDAHRVIFRQMIGLMERSRAIDLITIQEELLRRVAGKRRRDRLSGRVCWTAFRTWSTSNTTSRSFATSLCCGR